MDLHPAVAHLAPLLGTWRGAGRGHYPTIDPFEYTEEVTFGHVGKPFLAYNQRTKGADGAPLHAECGYWRPAGEQGLELLIVHPSGIAEILVGEVMETHFGLVVMLAAGAADEVEASGAGGADAAASGAGGADAAASGAGGADAAASGAGGAERPPGRAVPTQRPPGRAVPAQRPPGRAARLRRGPPAYAPGPTGAGWSWPPPPSGWTPLNAASPSTATRCATRCTWPPWASP